jgi:hypothetical protein
MWAQAFASGKDELEPVRERHVGWNFVHRLDRAARIGLTVHD